MTNKLRRRTVGMAAMLLASVSAQAATFEGSTSGDFFGAVAEDPDNGIIQIVFPGRIEWGVPVTGRSSLEFEGADFDAEAGQTFNVGSLEFDNQTIEIGTGISSVLLGVTFEFTIPSLPDEVFTYTITLENTPNAPGPPGSDDTITIPEEHLFQELNIGGQVCTLQVWFGVGGNSFSVPEGEAVIVELNGVITCHDGGLTIALLGAALGGIGILNRRVRK